MYRVIRICRVQGLLFSDYGVGFRSLVSFLFAL